MYEALSYECMSRVLAQVTLSLRVPLPDDFTAVLQVPVVKIVKLVKHMRLCDEVSLSRCMPLPDDFTAVGTTLLIFFVFVGMTLQLYC